MILLFPTEFEAARLRKLRPDLDIRICGVGAVESALSMMQIIAEAEEVLLCGIAGAYDRTLQKGEVVAIAEERFCRLMSGYSDSYSPTIPLEGLPTLRSNTVSQCGAAADGADIENMEGAAIFALCNAHGVPVAEIRAISNYVGEERKEWAVELATERLATYLAEKL